MGRSRLKYSDWRSHGSNDSVRGSRGGSASSHWSGKSKRSGGRALESNAFRYEERDNVDDTDGDTVDVTTEPTRRQFFADEQNYRDMGESKESYFRTKVMERWEADDDDDDDIHVATSTVGVMDFAWIAEQLKAVPPSVRYQIDPKYCGDFSFTQPVDDELCEPESTKESLIPVVSKPAPTAAAAVDDRTFASPVSALDDLLALSSSAATSVSASTTSVPLSVSAAPVGAVASTTADSQENLEDWLDDVLDM